MPFFKKGIEYQRNTQAGLTELLENTLGYLGFDNEKKIFEDGMKITREEAKQTIMNKSISCLLPCLKKTLMRELRKLRENMI